MENNFNNLSENSNSEYSKYFLSNDDEINSKYGNLPKFVYGNFFIRAIAFTIDILIIYSISNIINNFLTAITSKNLNNLLTILLSLLIYLLYFTLMTKFTNGQTIGKIFLNLRVVSLKTNDLSWSTVINREFIGRYILKIFPILYCISLFTPKYQNIDDMINDTSVINETNYKEYLKIIQK